MRKIIAFSIVVLLLLAACSFAPTRMPAQTPISTATPPVPPKPGGNGGGTPTATRLPSPTPVPTLTAKPTAIPSPTPVPPVSLSRFAAGTLVHPLGAAVINGVIYTIDSGRLKAVDALSTTPRLVSPPDGIVDSHPIQELAALAYSAQAKALFLLDRTGAVYGWDMASRWWLERKPGGNSSANQEYLVDIAADGQAVYLLDTNLERVLKRTTTGWTVLVTSSNLDGAIRMAVAGDLFVLTGERAAHPARLLRLRGTTLSEVKVSGGMEQPSLIASGAGGLLLIDRGFRRVRLIDTATGDAHEVLAGSDADILALSSSAESSVLLGADWLVRVRGALPDQLGVRPPRSAAPLSPHNLATLATLQRLRMPIAGALLPYIDRSLPGSPRPYRFGIHEGIDFYSGTTGVNIVKGTEVLAAGDGTVVHADLDYKEASSAEVQAWLDEALDKHMTPAAIQDRLGGRQVWIDHGNGLATRYLHLSRIANGLKVGSVVKAGDVIAYAGNSGTEEAAAGLGADVHLHFEVRVGNGFLGQWLSPIETRRWLMTILGNNS